MALRAALLDLDGTLMDTIPDLASAANAMRVELGMSPLREDVIATFVGKGIENLVRRTLAGAQDADENPVGFDEALASFKRNYHVVNGEKSVIFDGVLEGLRGLRELGLKLAVVTNKPEEFTLPLLRNTGVAGLFDAVVSGDTCARKKPDPLPMLHACELLGVDASDAVAIGDSINDALAARAAGCAVLAVPYGYNEGRDVRTLDVDAIVPTLVDAAEWVRRRQESAQ
jgi:phosphoglycolate phosphatase